MKNLRLIMMLLAVSLQVLAALVQEVLMQAAELLELALACLLRDLLSSPTWLPTDAQASVR